MFESAAVADPIAYEASLVQRIAELERSKSAAAAEQARVTAYLDAARRAREAADGVPAAKRGRGRYAENALAPHDYPNPGG
ncbi:MAG: HNH endonuclease, partial [Mycobacterium sp.]